MLSKQVGEKELEVQRMMINQGDLRIKSYVFWHIGCGGGCRWGEVHRLEKGFVHLWEFCIDQVDEMLFYGIDCTNVVLYVIVMVVSMHEVAYGLYTYRVCLQRWPLC